MKILNYFATGVLSFGFLATLDAQTAGPSTSLADAAVTVAAVKEEAPLFSQAELEQMLAPIALYPDALLAQVLIAATYPLEVVQAARFVEDNPGLKGSTLENAVAQKDWDPSIQSLTVLPDVLSRMSKELDWTQKVGDAFLAQEDDVMDTIQFLRNEAYSTGALQQQTNLRAKKEQNIIIIESANPQVVYVPYYQPAVVYGAWRWADYPPVYWNPPYGGYQSSYSFGFYWGSGIRFSTSYYYSTWDWPRRQVVINVHNHYYRRKHPQVHHHHHYVRWKHSPVHRRGVEYRGDRLRKEYASRYYERRDRDRWEDFKDNRKEWSRRDADAFRERMSQRRRERNNSDTWARRDRERSDRGRSDWRNSRGDREDRENRFSGRNGNRGDRDSDQVEAARKRLEERRSNWRQQWEQSNKGERPKRAERPDRFQRPDRTQKDRGSSRVDSPRERPRPSQRIERKEGESSGRYASGNRESRRGERVPRGGSRYQREDRSQSTVKPEASVPSQQERRSSRRNRSERSGDRSSRYGG